MQATYRVLVGDVLDHLAALPDASVQAVITSPPYYGLRSYLPSDHPDKAREIGQEPTPQAYIARLVAVFRAIKRVLRPDGTCWVNLGDCYAGSGRGAWATPSDTVKETYIPDPTTLPPTQWDRPPKNLMLMPARFALAMQDDGWILRSDIIWTKPNPMPESVLDRPVRAHEYIFLFTQSSIPQFWVHRDRSYADRTFKRPSPDYVWIHRETGEERKEKPPDAEHWRRKNLWRSCEYYYDAAAIHEHSQASDGGATPRHRAVGHGTSRTHSHPDKQRGHSRRHAGFNDRWDAMPRAQQMAFGHLKRDTWHVATEPFLGEHYAVMPEAIAETCVLAGCPEGGTVLDPFAGSGTTLAVANRLGRHAIGVELNPDYVPLIERRCQQSWFVFAETREGEWR